MEDRRIEVKVGKTIEVAKFEFARIDASFSRRLREGEDVEVAYGEAWDLVNEQVGEQATAAAEGSKEKVFRSLRREAGRSDVRKPLSSRR